MADLTLAVIIVTFNTRGLVLECLNSVREDAIKTGVSFRVIVVDNASRDRTATAIRTLFPSVHLIENSANVGPARAFNQGLAASAEAEYVLLMNSDIKVLPGTLGPMLDYLDRHSHIAGVSVRQVNSDGTARKFRKSLGMNLWPPQFDRILPVTLFGTTFHMGRRSMFNEDQIGMFDEYYYFFHEDLDWSIRAYRRGLMFQYLPELGVVHHGARGRVQNRGAILGEFYRANVYLQAKLYGRFSARLVYLVQTAELLCILAFLRLAGRQDSIDAATYRSAFEKQQQLADSLRLMKHARSAMLGR